MFLKIPHFTRVFFKILEKRGVLQSSTFQLDSQQQQDIACHKSHYLSSFLSVLQFITPDMDKVDEFGASNIVLPQTKNIVVSKELESGSSKSSKKQRKRNKKGKKGDSVKFPLPDESSVPASERHDLVKSMSTESSLLSTNHISARNNQEHTRTFFRAGNTLPETLVQKHGGNHGKTFNELDHGSFKDKKNNPLKPHIDPSKNQRTQRNHHSETTPSKTNGLPKMNCSEYWSIARIDEGIQSGKIVEGAFRISQKNYNNSYIRSSDGVNDILIEGLSNRNRALHGDIVAVELLDEDKPVKKEVEQISRKLAVEFGNVQITEENLKHIDQKRGRVVRIMNEKHCRKVAGTLKQYKSNAYGFALLSPQDSRLPRVMIPLNECPKEFMSRPQDFESVLFTADIVNWKRTCGFASGKLIKHLGNAGEIEPETEGFLTEYNVDYSPFPEDVLACLPSNLPWKIPKEEYLKRKDLRNETVFTIDPATARDLDDALSCKLKDDGNFEVGVHIADVSYFIEEDDSIDKIASDRATSVYLVQKVVPMLPRLLCEHLCSLNPNEDKLTFSVIWTLTPDGKVISEWFGRSIIRSCSKLSYDHAQQMIETSNYNRLDVGQFPGITGGQSISDIYTTVNHLYKLSLQLRKKRFDSGALALNQPKLTFTLDMDTGMPNGCSCFIARDSNHLVEEFMLLANMAVAHRLLRSLPEHALLRRHPSPNSKMMEDLLAICKRSDVNLEPQTSKTLHESLEKLKRSESLEQQAVYFAAVSLCSKPMQLAKYFCAGAIDDETLYCHYALNIPLYTHFTSPIRRYPDVIVHRMLTAALGESSSLKKNFQEFQQIAEHCNDKKAASKKVQELSNELFFTSYLRQFEELQEQAVIVGMLDSAIDVLLLHSGFVKRIYCNSLSLHKWKVNKDDKDTIVLFWKMEEALEGGNAKNSKEEFNEAEFEGPKQTLQIFDKLTVIMKSEKRGNGPYKVNVYIPKPE